MPTETLHDALGATRWGTLLTEEQLARVAAESIESCVATGAFICRKGGGGR
jgi:hypothetical protein